VTAFYNINIISFEQFYKKNLLTMKSNEESFDFSEMQCTTTSDCLAINVLRFYS